MRVALITPGFSASEADWCIPAVLDLVRELSSTVDLHVFALRYPHHRRPYRVHGTPVTPFGGQQDRTLGRLRMFARCRRTLLSEARRQPFDLIHALWAHEPGYLAVSIGQRLGVPVLVSLLGGELENLSGVRYGGQHGMVTRRLVRSALSRADQVTAGSQFFYDRALRRVPEHRLELLPLAVNADRFRPATDNGSETTAAQPGPVEGRVKLLSVGSLTAVKAPGNLVRAFAAMAHDRDDTWLHVVGDGAERGRCERLAAELGVQDRIVFHGEIAHDRLADYYRAADLCVLSSLYESQSLFVLEAAACGKATAGSAVGVLPELVPPRWLCPPGDVRALAGAVEAALADSPGSHAARLRAAVETRFSTQAITPRWLELYRQTAAGSLRERPSG